MSLSFARLMRVSATIKLVSALVACGQQSPSFTEARTQRAPAETSADAKKNTLDPPAPEQEQEQVQEQEPKDITPPNSNGNEPPPADDNGGTDDANNEETENGSVDDATDEGGDGRFSSEIKTDAGQTVVIDNFQLPDTFPVVERVENSRNPLKEAAHTQVIGAKRLATSNILARTAQTKVIQKTAPIPYQEAHTIGAENKPLDLFVTVDDSESFSQASIERARSSIHKLVEDIYVTDWRLFIGGLEGIAGSYDRFQINKGSLTLVQAKAAIDNALTSIFAEGSNGDERVIRSLNRLAFDYRGADRDHAFHAFLLITDAPNCKDRNNSESSACIRSEGQNDHHNFITAHQTNVPVYMRQNMQLIAAYYRQSSNLSVCGNADDIENPGSEVLKLNSQYAQMSFAAERAYDPSISSAALPRFVGDLCSTTESLSWLTAFTSEVKTAIARRFALSQRPDTFATPDESYNLALHQPLTTVLPAASMSLRDQQVVVLNPALAGSVTAVYNRQNNYRRTNYDNILNPVPENGTLSLSWSGGGSTACVAANSFTGLDPSIKCRHSSDDLYLRDVDFLPNLAPGSAPLNISVSYFNYVQPVYELEVTSADAIFTDSVSITAHPNGFNPNSATITSLQNGRTVRLTFGSALPPGQYTVAFHDFSQTRKSFVIPSAAAGGLNSYACYMPETGVSASLSSDGKISITPADAAYPCQLDVASGTVYYEGLVPESSNGARSLKIAYKGFVSPIGLLPLSYPPYENDVAVTLGSGASVTVADPATYTVENNQLHLNSPLQPGDSLTMEYTFWPPINSCYILSGRALSGHTYHVWYGPPGEEDKLMASDFTIESRENGQTICMPRDTLTHGHRIVVGYITSNTPNGIK